MLELDHAAGTITLCRDPSGGDLPALEALAAPGECLESPDRVVIARRRGPAAKPLARQVDVFLDCIEKQVKPEISAAASLRGLRVIWRLYEAEEQKTVADLRGLWGGDENEDQHID
jgi:hypothetical protein